MMGHAAFLPHARHSTAPTSGVILRRPVSTGWRQALPAALQALAQLSGGARCVTMAQVVRGQGGEQHLLPAPGGHCSGSGVGRCAGTCLGAAVRVERNGSCACRAKYGFMITEFAFIKVHNGHTYTAAATVAPSPYAVHVGTASMPPVTLMRQFCRQSQPRARPPTATTSPQK